MINEIILLVEDNPDDEALAIRALTKNNTTNRVIVARDGVEALSLLFGEGGIRANMRTHTLPVVMLTTPDEEEDMIRSYEAGANSHVRKPIDFAEFTSGTAQLGVYWLQLNRMPRAVTSMRN